MNDVATFCRCIGNRPERPYYPLDRTAELLCELASTSQLRPEQIATLEKIGFIVRTEKTPDGFFEGAP